MLQSGIELSCEFQAQAVDASESRQRMASLERVIE
jgi:hypothetical protein